MGHPYCFGIRHLSPAGAYHLRQLLDEKKPDLILVEGPSDFNDLMDDMVKKETNPPFAVMAFTKELPVRTILYPFAEYSPEYQAILWAREHGTECRFMDLPSGVFLGIQKAKEEERSRLAESRTGVSGEYPSGGTPEAGEDPSDGTPGAGEYPPGGPAVFTSEQVYRLLDQSGGEDGHETFWEHAMEHTWDCRAYGKGAELFGRQLREMTAGRDDDWPEILVREAYMRRIIADAVQEGFQPERIVAVTGAYHVAGLNGQEEPMNDCEIHRLPRVECNVTLMPYSYYRLSSRSGYGAGNKAPAYYEMLWRAFCEGDRDMGTYRYLTALSAYQREHGFPVSSAEVIEGVELARSLAALHGYSIPSLRDLRDAAVTSMGHGSFSELALAVADTEIGAAVGSLPQGVSRTCLQDDFYRQLHELRLDQYKSETACTLALDLREKLGVKSESAANRDLKRSFFLHRLRVLGVNFAKLRNIRQDTATWAESWDIRWSPEVEIELVEAALKGDTIAAAASFVMKEKAMQADKIGEAAGIIEAACFCGIPEMVVYATDILQGLSVEAAGFAELARTGESVSAVVRFGSIRRLDSSPLLPVLNQMFLRACLVFISSCTCDNQAAKGIMEAMERLNSLCIHHDFLDEERWVRLLMEAASRDDLNTGVSGFGAAILLERGRMEDEELSREVQRRLSKGIPAELGAGWFEGLSRKNRYALIARLSLWRELDEYLDTLDEEEFRRALVFLRRAFADFSSREKMEVAENMGEIWQVSTSQASEVLNGPLKEDEKEFVDSLGDFDFDDI